MKKEEKDGMEKYTKVPGFSSDSKGLTGNFGITTTQNPIKSELCK